MIVVKINDNGTPDDPSDDQIAGGATFEFRLDNGNGIYEPDTADAPVLATIEAPFGFAVWTPPGPGDYWVTEAISPPGLDAAPPVLVQYRIPAQAQNCMVNAGRLACAPDDDQTTGFTAVIVTNSPTGGVEPATATPSGGELPATDTPPSSPDHTPGLWLVAATILAISTLVLSDLPRRRPS